MIPENEPSQNIGQLRNYFLLFKTYYGNLLGWCIRTGLSAQDIPGNIESAARYWLSSAQGKSFIQENAHEKQVFDYADALMQTPPEILARHSIFLWTPIYEILELKADKNLLPDELKDHEEQ